MGAALAILVARIIDPIGLLVTLGVVLCSRRRWIILVAAAVSSVMVESILTATQILYVWGEGLLFGLVAGIIQASLIFWIRARAKREPRNQKEHG